MMDEIDYEEEEPYYHDDDYYSDDQDTGSSNGSHRGLIVELREPTPTDVSSLLLLGAESSSKKPSSSSTTGTATTQESLSPQETNDLLQRLPPIERPVDEENQDFFMREKSLKPPRTAETIQQTFPPEQTLEKPEQLKQEEEALNGSSLRVLRYLPEGKVDRSVPHISITFSQPMIELSSVENVESVNVLEFIEISPMPKNGGRFKWIGTKTVLFEPLYRFDMSTRYTVTIKAHKAKSATGGILEKDVVFAFETPRLNMLNKLPHSTVAPLNEFPVFYMEFDQEIDPAVLMKHIAVNSGYNTQLVLNDGRSDQNEQVKKFIENLLNEYNMLKRNSSIYYAVTNKLSNAPPNRHLWFMIDVKSKRVELSESVQVVLRAGATSSEGNLPTEADISFSVSNYPSFTVNNTYGGTKPLEAFHLVFSNGIDCEELQEAHVKVTPSIERFELQPSSTSLFVRGKIMGRTEYVIELSENIRDVYGQKLQGNRTFKFNVGSAAQSLNAFQTGLIVLDPTVNTKPVYSVFSVNLAAIHVQVYQVTPSNYNSNLFYVDKYSNSVKTFPGKKVMDSIINTNGKQDEPTVTEIDLSLYLQYPKENLGQLLVVVEPDKSSWKGDWRYRPVYVSWNQVTKIALDGFYDSADGTIYCWANSLSDGSILKEGITFRQTKVSTDVKPSSTTGVATISHKSYDGAVTMVANLGNDCCFVPDLYLRCYKKNGWLAYNMFNDRGLYKPNEEIFIKGYARDIKIEQYGQRYKVHLPSKGAYTYVVTDSRGAKYHEGTLNISESGSFDLKFKIPDNVNLGTHILTVNGLNMTTTFKVEEFRTPEFTVSSSIPQLRYVVNGVTICKTKAEYYSGGSLSGSKCQYIVKQSEAHYSPPNFSDYSFGTTINNPFYSYYGYSSNDFFAPPPAKFEGIIDGEGQHELAISFKESERLKKCPVNITVESTVQDINRQTMSSTSSFLVHPCRLYCGLKLEKMFTKPKVPVNLCLVCCDIEGNTVENVDMELVVKTKVEKKKGYSIVQEDVEALKTTIKSQKEPIKYPVSFDKSGIYVFNVSIKDPETHLTNTCAGSLYITGGSKSKKDVVGSRLVRQNVLMVPDKTEYQVNEEAKIIIQSPFDSVATGLVTLCLNSVTETYPITIDPNVGSLEFIVPIKKEYIPNVKVTVSLQGSESRTDSLGNVITSIPNLPAYARGDCQLNVSRRQHLLTVEAVPEKQFVTPGVSTFIDVIVRDEMTKTPQPNSEVCVVAVDEAVLALTGYRISNPISSFINNNSVSLHEFSLRDHLFVKTNLDEIYVEASSDSSECEGEDENCCDDYDNDSFGGCMECACMSCNSRTNSIQKCCCRSKSDEKCKECEEEGGEAPRKPQKPTIALRKNFNPVAVFSPVSMTDSEGRARVNFTLPDNLTRYRVTAVAVQREDLFGLAESSIVAQLPLAIRPSLPRFLNFGDRAEFTCVLQNQTMANLSVHIAIAYTGLELLDTSKRGLKVLIPALQRAEIRFPMQAIQVGVAKFQVGVSVSDSFINFSDAVEKEVRVFTPATTEAFAVYGEMDDTCNVFQPVKTPGNVYTQFGGLQITTSSTALASLTDSFLYLYNYPFDCTEQLSSRVLSIVALKDVLYAFKVKDMPSESTLLKKLENMLSILYGRQHPNGGYGWWTYSNGCETSPYLSCHVGHAFARAKKAGFTLNETCVSKLVNVLTNIHNYFYHYYSEESKRSIRAYAYYVLGLLGNSNAAQLAETLYKECGGVGAIPLDCLAWIANTIFLGNRSNITSTVSEILNYMLMRVNETPQTANFVTKYGDDVTAKQIMLHSDRKVDGICLEALITIAPKNDLIAKVVKGLLAHKKKGRWGNTQENVFILLALNTYFHVFEGVTPQFVVKMWLGDDFCGEQQFHGRNKDENMLTIPMKQLDEDASKTLVISKEGPGRLYYRLAMDYAPKNLLLPPLDYGFQIQRTYEGVTNPSHAQFDKEQNCWKFKAGEMIRVKINFTTTSRRYHVALVDFLPGGLEALNPELKGAPQAAQQRTSSCWWNWPWYEHQNIRDERVEAFSSLVWEGSHSFNYIARATSIGSFVIPPTKAEEMYSPEIFGRSSTMFAQVYE
ncbi:hypothetical protein C9374_003975 [Naegleria lovaniensis]|uniref:Alpha-2-macroglobulin domain-containing protein n=1 Tax=Naegleria lovaniensis TaxID=51637 RepID=A0AA88H8V9_NAELO|nr:uncharacterized protein C9374_003975 [Naegleria lovaniensis]KAG2394211.1 hypothetical protein C9374_003975 [Naegleria lovaniensis]